MVMQDPQKGAGGIAGCLLFLATILATCACLLPWHVAMVDAEAPVGEGNFRYKSVIGNSLWVGWRTDEYDHPKIKCPSAPPSTPSAPVPTPPSPPVNQCSPNNPFCYEDECDTTDDCSDGSQYKHDSSCTFPVEKGSQVNLSPICGDTVHAVRGIWITIAVASLFGCCIAFLTMKVERFAPTYAGVWVFLIAILSLAGVLVGVDWAIRAPQTCSWALGGSGGSSSVTGFYSVYVKAGATNTAKEIDELQAFSEKISSYKEAQFPVGPGMGCAIVSFLLITLCAYILLGSAFCTEPDWESDDEDEEYYRKTGSPGYYSSSPSAGYGYDSAYGSPTSAYGGGYDTYGGGAYGYDQTQTSYAYAGQYGAGTYGY